MPLPLSMIGVDGGVLVLLAGLMFVFPIWIIPAVLAYVALDRIPPPDRRQDPALALLLLIPVFSFLWAFFVYPRISDSLAAHFARRGDASAGNCGHSLALAFCICTLIPPAHLVALVCMILFFIKVFTLLGQIERRPIAA